MFGQEQTFTDVHQSRPKIATCPNQTAKRNSGKLDFFLPLFNKAIFPSHHPKPLLQQFLVPHRRASLQKQPVTFQVCWEGRLFISKSNADERH